MDIKDLLKKCMVMMELKSQNKNGIIEELVDLAVVSGYVKDKNSLLNSVMEREAKKSTGIGFGVAMPHGKSEGVDSSFIAFGRSKYDVDFEALDGDPCRLFFLIAVPENATDEHLKVLSLLSRRLINPDIREKLLNAADGDEVLSILE